MSQVGAYFYVAVLLGAMPAHAAYAVCLNPKTLVSGYKVDLREEIKSSAFIVIGRVTEAHALTEKSADPEDITAYIYTVRVLKRIKGTLPSVVHFRSENNSGRYPMTVGERHLLFLTRKGRYFEADSCGNSSLMPQGQATLAQLKAVLSEPHAP